MWLVISRSTDTANSSWRVSVKAVLQSQLHLYLHRNLRIRRLQSSRQVHRSLDLLPIPLASLGIPQTLLSSIRILQRMPIPAPTQTHTLRLLHLLSFRQLPSIRCMATLMLQLSHLDKMLRLDTAATLPLLSRLPTLRRSQRMVLHRVLP
jgi:hypothetical protein